MPSGFALSCVLTVATNRAKALGAATTNPRACLFLIAAKTGDWWSLLIVRDAFDGIRRFGAFQKNLGIARSMLTARLRALVDKGVLELVPSSNGTACQEYMLAEKGRALFSVVVALRRWGEDYLYALGEQYSTLIDRKTGEQCSASLNLDI